MFPSDLFWGLGQPLSALTENIANTLVRTFSKPRGVAIRTSRVDSHLLLEAPERACQDSLAIGLNTWYLPSNVVMISFYLPSLLPSVPLIVEYCVARVSH